MRNRVCSIIVTYNRKELLIRNMKSLLRQTTACDILIVDNASTDGTKELLKENGYLLLDNLYYLYEPKNIGGAGGFYHGLRSAYEKGYELFWLMDDDGYALNDLTLEHILTAYDIKRNRGQNVIMNSVVVQENKEELTFGLFGIKNIRDLKEKEEEYCINGAVNPFNGTLIDRDTVEKIGFPREEFFIGGDEVEYIERFKKSGGILYTVMNSYYFHPIPDTIYRYTLGKKRAVSNMPVWKQYYRTRNMTYVLKEYGSLHKVLCYVGRILISTLLFDSKTKWKRTKYILLAAKDGLYQDFSKNDMHLKEI